MIISFPTKLGAGISIYGDRNDLYAVHETLTDLRNRSPMSGDLQDFAAGFAYEFRKTLDGKREFINGTPYGEFHAVYGGFRMLWPLFLVQLGILRWCAAFSPTSRSMQADLYRLEAAAEEALYKLDALIGKECMEWLEAFDMFPTDFTTEFVTEISLRFVTETRPGKLRFRRLPDYLNMIWALSPEYEDFERQVQDDAAFKKLLINLPGDQLEIKW